jgi:hypothetical protein
MSNPTFPANCTKELKRMKPNYLDVVDYIVECPLYKFNVGTNEICFKCEYYLGLSYENESIACKYKVKK